MKDRLDRLLDSWGRIDKIDRMSREKNKRYRAEDFEKVLQGGEPPKKIKKRRFYV